MSLLDYLDKIRNKPEKSRRFYAMSTSGAVIAVIFAVWVGTFSIRFSNDDIAAKLNQTASVNNSASPFSDLQQSISTGFQSFQNIFNGSGNQTSTTTVQVENPSDPSTSSGQATSSSTPSSSGYVYYPSETQTSTTSDGVEISSPN